MRVAESIPKPEPVAGKGLTRAVAMAPTRVAFVEQIARMCDVEGGDEDTPERAAQFACFVMFSSHNFP